MFHGPLLWHHINLRFLTSLSSSLPPSFLYLFTPAFVFPLPYPPIINLSLIDSPHPLFSHFPICLSWIVPFSLLSSVVSSFPIHPKSLLIYSDLPLYSLFILLSVTLLFIFSYSPPSYTLFSLPFFLPFLLPSPSTPFHRPLSFPFLCSSYHPFLSSSEPSFPLAYFCSLTKLIIIIVPLSNCNILSSLSFPTLSKTLSFW